jgi:hypothetical protein
MKARKCRIIDCEYNGGNIESLCFKWVDGLPVTIPGFEEYGFFAYSPDGYSDCWKITESSSGYGCGPMGYSIQEAIENAAQYLSSANQITFAKRLTDIHKEIAESKRREFYVEGCKVIESETGEMWAIFENAYSGVNAFCERLNQECQDEPK